MTTTLRRRDRLRRYAIAAAVVCATVATAACSDIHAPDSPPPTATATDPLPPGVDWTPAKEPAPAVDSCNATASLPPDPMPPRSQMPPGSSMDAIARQGVLTVGLDIGSNLFSFRDPITGNVEGFDVDIAREVARDIFGDPNRVAFRILTADERFTALENRQVDLVVNTLSITCDRLADVAFSTVYYEASQRILALRGSPIESIEDLSGKRVCVARGTTSIGRLQRQVPAAKLVSVTTWADCLVLMQQGQVDATSTDDAILAGLASQDPYVHIVGESLSTEPYGIGINRDEPDLVRFVNGTLARIRADGTWFSIYNRWLSNPLGQAPYPPPATYRQ
ncbi:glutamate ABC transporter substrate-binding protein [Jongsikchunia kroppenstedtii]|uniref:glutamate ABC transporter substrate-binding protein n=1 Tax=Jongsikchunia kroppenstedtii TaxID=1121721 RepID=UPI000475FBD2|nr:glutamate ABC transporter substrate-binding protein [Jongsikchunia kroppenstedtii]